MPAVVAGPEQGQEPSGREGAEGGGELWPDWLSSLVLEESERAFANAQGRLRNQLVERAIAVDAVDAGYDVVSTPLGDLLVACTGDGLVRVGFMAEGYDQILGDLAHRLGPRLLRAPRLVSPAAEQIVSYLEGQRTRFDLAVDLRLSTGFRRHVLDVLRQVPRGTTHSYAEIARSAGHPQAVRAVGSACANNPLPIVIPCHRVVRSDGSLGGYVGGLAAKRWLLALEAREEEELRLD